MIQDQSESKKNDLVYLGPDGLFDRLGFRQRSQRLRLL